MMYFVAHVELMPGCYDGNQPPVISRHKSFKAACRKAAKSDRLRAVDRKSGITANLPQIGHRHLGAGRYGCAGTVDDLIYM